MGAHVQHLGAGSPVVSAYGGTHPPFAPEQVSQIIATVKASAPIEHELPGYNWTLKKLRRWVKLIFDCEVGRRTLSKWLHTHDVSWKKCQKLLKRANPAKRAAFIVDFQAVYTHVCQGELRSI